MEEQKTKHAFWIADRVTGYLNATLTADQIAELFAWTAENEENQKLFEQLVNEPELNAGHAKFKAFDTTLALHKVLPRLDQRIPSVKLYRNLRFMVAAAACILIAISVVVFIWNSGEDIHQKYEAFAKRDIAPGKNSATLTLADGRKIRLSDAVEGELAKEAGVRITKSKDGQLIYTVLAAPGEIASQARGTKQSPGLASFFNTLSTAKGEMYQVILPDGSKVWLNAASSLKYPASFANLKERKVILDGEGYFEVTHNAKQPFRVQTVAQLIEDIGTAFNVNSYSDEPDTKTTLVEGSVAITSFRGGEIASQARNDGNKGSKGIELKPGEQGISTGGNLQVKNADLAQIIAWKNGDFIFKNDDFKTIMRQLARWYNVEVIYDASAPDNIQLGGYVSRSKNISSVLKIMEITGKVHFKLEGRRVIVTK